MKVKSFKNFDTEQIVGYSIKCPGCKKIHDIYTVKFEDQAVWNFNGNIDNPTFTPSLLYQSGIYAGQNLVDENTEDGKINNDFLRRISKICHSFITDGKIEFLSDCTHELANQIFELPEIE